MIFRALLRTVTSPIEIAARTVKGTLNGEMVEILKENRKESEIKSAILKWLNLQPRTFAWTNFTTGVPARMVQGKLIFRKNPSAGMPDIGGVKKGRAFALEVKLPDEKAKDHQVKWMQDFDRAGGFAAVVRSLDDAIEAWREI